MNVQSAKCMTPSPVVLSDDLIAEVLSLLSMESLLRLSCVSKSWRALISDPVFVELHLNRLATSKTLFKLMKRQTLSEFEDGGHLNEGYCILYPTLSVDSYYIWNDKECSYIAGSCNCLICLTGYSSTYAYKEYWLRIWNPATKKLTQKIGYFRDSAYFNFKFGYDNSTDTFKVVAFGSYLTNIVRIFTLGDNIWRDIESFPVVLLNRAYKNRGAYLSGTLNWLAIDNNVSYSVLMDAITVEKFRIVSLDLGTETYNQYMLPSGFDEMLPHMPTLVVLGDCLCFSYSPFSYSPDNINFVIWKMQIFGVEKSWVQFLEISYETQHPHFDMAPLFLFEDILIVMTHQNQLILYNLRDNTTEERNTVTIADNGTTYYVHLEIAYDYVGSVASTF